ncbi:MAG: four-carbon acid sugar kinase family protein [Synergistaceae bacterium]|jgi:uncharacterized protein YgbK (DUF1537 family)|nr:four-carbon acid sugar kinase family protein [Synergistaceae bacterium]
MFEYVIVADDYTGAAETASKFINGGYRSSVTLDPGSLGSMQHFTVVALDTETFFDTPEEAEKKLTNVARNLLPWKNSTVFFKRVEPSLRGNVASEIRAMARELGFEYVVVVPALSRGRRFIEEGTVYLDTQEHNIPSSIATEGKSATLDTTAETLREGGFEPIKVTLEEIRGGKVPEIVGRKAGKKIAKKGCFCFDAETDEDLKAIVRGVLNVTPAKNVLWVGAMGLAEALAMTPKPFIVVVGTPHPRSIRQARQLLEHAMVYPVQLDVGVLEGGDAVIDAERTRVAEEAENLLRCGQSILLAGTVEGRFVRDTYPDGDIDGFLGFLAETVRDIMGRVKIGGLCVTGGDCTVRIVQKAKAESVVLLEEIQEGITLSRLSGGSFDGLPMITKSGALGGERALVHCMEYFTQGQ